jgi:hypothetical protein
MNGSDRCFGAKPDLIQGSMSRADLNSQKKCFLSVFISAVYWTLRFFYDVETNSLLGSVSLYFLSSGDFILMFFIGDIRVIAKLEAGFALLWSMYLSLHSTTSLLRNKMFFWRNLTKLSKGESIRYSYRNLWLIQLFAVFAVFLYLILKLFDQIFSPCTI